MHEPAPFEADLAQLQDVVDRLSQHVRGIEHLAKAVATRRPSPARAYTERRVRDRIFGAELFADPAWDMLLDLARAHELGRRVSVSDLCIAAQVPPTTALRWIGHLEAAALIEREPDPKDGRRVFVRISAIGLGKMLDYFAATETA